MVVVFLGSLLIGAYGLVAVLRSPSENVEKPSILALDLDGVIVDKKHKTVSRAFCCVSTHRAAWSDQVRNFGPS